MIHEPETLQDVIMRLEGRIALLESYAHVPSRREASEGDIIVLNSDLRLIWSAIGELLMKIPTGAVDNLYLSLKSPTAPSLVIDNAVVITRDESGTPTWYMQFDYLRGVPTP